MCSNSGTLLSWTSLLASCTTSNKVSQYCAAAARSPQNNAELLEAEVVTWERLHLQRTHLKKSLVISFLLSSVLNTHSLSFGSHTTQHFLYLAISMQLDFNHSHTSLKRLEKEPFTVNIFTKLLQPLCFYLTLFYVCAAYSRNSS